MEGKVLYVVLALVASSTAASISGMASLDFNQASAGGQVTFPRIPGINSPLFGSRRPTPSSPVSNTTSSPQNDSTNAGFGSIFSHIPGISNFFPGPNRNKNNNSNGTTATNSTTGTNDRGIPGLPNIDDFVSAIPGLKNFMSGDFPLPGNSPLDFDIEGMISRIPALNGNGTNGANFTLPDFPQLPDVNDGPYIPGVSEALGEARQHLQAMFNITSDISSGMRDVIYTALSSEHPADSIRIILTTIAKVYGTVAANCPLIIVGERVFHEGVRLAFEVVRSIGNVAVGPQNNIINNISSG